MPSLLHDLRMNGRSRRETRRRAPPWLVVLLLAFVMFVASVGFTATVVAYYMLHDCAVVETFLGFRE